METKEIQNAARELRTCQGLSQQAMASMLTLSMGAVRNYESGAVADPEPRPLQHYVRVATLFARPDLAAIFRRALNEALSIHDVWDGQLTTEPVGAVDRLLLAAVLASVHGNIRENSALSEFRDPVLRALRGPCRLLIKKLHLKRNKSAWAMVAIEADLMGLPASWFQEEGR